MSWQVYLFIILMGIGMIATISDIGKPREPITNGTGVGVVIYGFLLIWLVASI